MQLMPATAQQYGVDPSDPAQNIQGGLTHLKYLLNKYGGSIPHAIAAYNAGEGTVDKVLSGKAHLPSETEAYVRKITGQPFAQAQTNSAAPIQANPAQPQPQQSDISGWRAYIPQLKPEDYPMIGGIAGGLLGAATTGGVLAPVLAALGGGMSGSAIQQQMENGTGQGTQNSPKVDPVQAIVEGAKQGAWELGGQTLGALQRRLGAGLYATGSGLSRPQFSQNFPTAVQEGLEGGRGTLPIFTAAGARRAYARVGDVPQQMVESAQANGTPGGNALDIIRNGMSAQARKTQQAAFPVSEGKEAGKYIRQFIDENSTKTQPQQVTPLAYPPSQVGGQQIYGPPVTIPGTSTPKQYSLTDLQGRKQYYQNRASNALKANNADRAVQLGGEMDMSAANGVKNLLENRVPGLKEANRKVQGTIGLNQSLNPSFRTPEDLMQMGVNPSVADVMTQSRSPWSLQRIMVEGLGAGMGMGAGMYSHSAVPALGIMAASHALASPLGQRMIGGGMYTAGRMTPMATRGIRIGANSAMQAPTEDDPQVEALRQAILRGEIK